MLNKRGGSTISVPTTAVDEHGRPLSSGRANFVKRALRKLTRPFRRLRKRSLSKRWDTIYARNGRYTASGTLAVTEEGNARDFALRLEILLRMIAKYRRTSHSRALDAGCGNGLFTAELVKLR